MPTKIEWTGETWNPIVAFDRRESTNGIRGWHCEHASDGCRNCYAEVINRRLGTGLDYKPGHLKDIVVTIEDKALEKPLHWRKPRFVFPGSMTDLFAKFVTDLMLDEIFAICAATPHLTYQFLTKRPDRLLEYARRAMGCGEHWLAHVERSHAPMWPLPNVWLGVSVENDKTKDRIDLLRQVPVASGAVRWISFEPLIGRVVDPDLSGIGWAVCGGESGHGARPMHPDWEEEIRKACAAQGTLYFFKQWGDFTTIYDRDLEDPDWRRCDAVARDTPRGQWLNLAGGQGFHGARVVRVQRVGKKVAGRLINGVEHNAMPSRIAA